ncbi:uncharacterized protein LOC109614430 [Musca domestica]|uniref:Uncharacterized protein LOC109614430 n=1 Tax=Musca domestica TaxID=7370 RepID=A0A9J7IFR7_MUSDO|nr:uncharacterized protein LOC109614430 [Musca domestica]
MRHLILPIILNIVVITCCLAIEHSLDNKSSSAGLLDVESSRRKKGHYFLHPYYGWHALTWIYWVKVKLVVIAFFAYLAWIYALRFLGPHSKKCSHSGYNYYNYGHYRSLDDTVQVSQIEKALNRTRRRRHLLRQTSSKAK